ncbi:MAG TPA: DUF2934 domain-containing protein [Candidatus Aquilonibacter sp.]|nr:DUF2934 domain-containing protein [Candidatus Aquilonibacter sp.]
MASKISCPEGHSTKGITVWDAAVALAEGRAIGACKKCGKAYQYRIDHTYADDPKETVHSFVVTRAIRLEPRLSGAEKLDPFLLVLREIKTGKEEILPTFWAFGHTGAHRAGHLAPILGLDEWKKLFRQLGASVDDPQQKIRERAYQLYEQRGRLDGHAVEDWLQAEAELAGRRTLQVAA